MIKSAKTGRKKLMIDTWVKDRSSTRMHSSKMCTVRLLTVSVVSDSGRGLPNSVPLSDADPWAQTPSGPLEPTTPWTESQTLVKTLPCPKLGLRTVKTAFARIPLTTSSITTTTQLTTSRFFSQKGTLLIVTIDQKAWIQRVPFITSTFLWIKLLVVSGTQSNVKSNNILCGIFPMQLYHEYMICHLSSPQYIEYIKDWQML